MNPEHARMRPSGKELALQRKMFEEAAFSGGTTVKYQSVCARSLTDISDELYKWAEPVEMDIIYDERPKISLLKRMNWYSEDPDIQPKIMYIPSVWKGKTVNVRRGDLVTVSNPINPTDEHIFQISQVATELIDIMFICNVVPYRKQEETTSEPSKNNKWLSVK